MVASKKSKKTKSVNKVIREEDPVRSINTLTPDDINRSVNNDAPESEVVDMQSTVSKVDKVVTAPVPRNLSFSISYQKLNEFAGRYAEGFNDVFRHQVPMDVFDRGYVNDGVININRDGYRDAFLNGLFYMYNSNNYRLVSYPDGVAPSDVLFRFAQDLGFEREVDMMSCIQYISNSEDVREHVVTNALGRVLSILTNVYNMERGTDENPYLAIVGLFRDLQGLTKASEDDQNTTILNYTFVDVSQSILRYDADSVPDRLSGNLSEYLSSYIEGTDYARAYTEVI